jgi:hypothetical protein
MPQTPWHFKGDYFESCNCEVNCPCIFGSPAHYEQCDVALAFHIRQGRYGEVTLDGLNFVQVARAPRQMQQGNWTQAIYIDQRATEEQRGALVAIASGEAGGNFSRFAQMRGNLLGVKYVPVQYTIKGRQRYLSVPGSLEMRVAAIEGGKPGSTVKLVNDRNIAGRGSSSRTMARASVHQFEDYGLRWDNTGKNGYYAQVEMSGP